jgi:hypothetical protein
MSTRGFICFVIDGRQKTQYIPGSSHPDHMGLTILRWLRTASADVADLRRHVRALRLIDPSTKPAAGDLERFGKYASAANADDWHNLLYWTGTDPALVLEAGVIIDQSRLPADSLYAEWGYVIDLDGHGLFEVYEGLQTRPHDRGRFAHMKLASEPGAKSFQPVALRVAWPLAALPDDPAFLAAASLTEEEEAQSSHELAEFSGFNRWLEERENSRATDTGD